MALPEPGRLIVLRCEARVVPGAAARNVKRAEGGEKNPRRYGREGKGRGRTQER